MQLLVNATQVASIEASGGEAVDGSVDDFGLEDLTGLFGNGLAQVVVVHMDARTIALVARDHS